MTDKELKKRIADTYHIECSEKQRHFIRAYQRRELRLSELLLMQLNYLKLPYAIILVCLFSFLASTVSGADAEKVLTMAAFLPLLAVLALVGLGNSERFHMDELEMSTRLSLRTLKAVRLSLAGLIGVISILSCACVCKAIFAYSMPFALLLAGFPYLVTSAACMTLLRTWHAKENIYGCTVIAASVSVFSFAAVSRSLLQTIAVHRLGCLALFAAALYWAAKEMYVYLKKSEEYQWNLC